MYALVNSDLRFQIPHFISLLESERERKPVLKEHKIYVFDLFLQAEYQMSWETN